MAFSESSLPWEPTTPGADGPPFQEEWEGDDPGSGPPALPDDDRFAFILFLILLLLILIF